MERLETLGAGSLFSALLPIEDEPEPLLAGISPLVAGRINLVNQMGFLPPSRRFDAAGLRVIATSRYANGYTGYGLGPSEWRRGLAIWSFSESGLMQREEFASPEEWLVEYLAPLAQIEVANPIDLRDAAQELWDSIEGDLPEPTPSAGWPAIADGVHTSRRQGIEFEETHVDGVRHGPMQAWTLDEDYDAEEYDDKGDVEDFEPRLRRGALRRSGSYENGFAQGLFRFFDPQGKLLQEVNYEDGRPHGPVVVQPEAAVGLCQISEVNYERGVPTSWSIAPFAATHLKLTRIGAGPATLVDVADHRPIILVDCHEQHQHPLREAAQQQLAHLGDQVAIIGVAANPGQATFGSRTIEVIGDSEGQLCRAYGHQHERWLGVTCLNATGAFLRAGRLSHFRFDAEIFGQG